MEGCERSNKGEIQGSRGKERKEEGSGLGPGVGGASPPIAIGNAAKFL